VMREAWAAHDPQQDARAEASAAAKLPERTRAFSDTYERIVAGVIAGRRRN
jgi:hypothetical protein